MLYNNEKHTHFIDLNRQFRIKGKDAQGVVPLALDQIAFPKAKLLLRETQEISPEAQYVFSFHADSQPITMANDEHHRIFRANNGCYVYDIPYYEESDERTDKKEDAAVLALIEKLRQKLLASSPNVTLLTGYDDISDDALGIYFTNGYARTPVTRQVGDGPYEDDQSLRGFRSENKIKRSFVFETPTWFSPEDIQKVVQIYLFKFVMPFMEYVREEKKKEIV